MRVDYIAPLVGEPAVSMQPESDRDRRTLEKILTAMDGQAGFGRDPSSGELLHVEIYTPACGKGEQR